MEERKRNQLEIKLKKMLEQLEQSEAKRKEPTNQFRNGNIIRRQKVKKVRGY